MAPEACQVNSNQMWLNPSSPNGIKRAGNGRIRFSDQFTPGQSDQSIHWRTQAEIRNYCNQMITEKPESSQAVVREGSYQINDNTAALTITL